MNMAEIERLLEEARKDRRSPDELVAELRKSMGDVPASSGRERGEVMGRRRVYSDRQVGDLLCTASQPKAKPEPLFTISNLAACWASSEVEVKRVCGEGGINLDGSLLAWRDAVQVGLHLAVEHEDRTFTAAAKVARAAANDVYMSRLTGSAQGPSSYQAVGRYIGTVGHGRRTFVSNSASSADGEFRPFPIGQVVKKLERFVEENSDQLHWRQQA